MKYKCADGLDRDKYIDEYLELDVKTNAINKKIIELVKERNDCIDRMNKISFEQLGGVGSVAVSKERERRRTKK